MTLSMRTLTLGSLVLYYESHTLFDLLQLRFDALDVFVSLLSQDLLICSAKYEDHSRANGTFVSLSWNSCLSMLSL